eukprot:782052_1
MCFFQILMYAGFSRLDDVLQFDASKLDDCVAVFEVISEFYDERDALYPLLLLRNFERIDEQYVKPLPTHSIPIKRMHDTKINHPKMNDKVSQPPSKTPETKEQNLQPELMMMKRGNHISINRLFHCCPKYSRKRLYLICY